MKRIPLMLTFALVLAGCGKDPMSWNQQSAAPADTAISYKAEPGEVVMLSAQDGADNPSSVSYQWSQTGGTAVLLGGAERRIASFVMPSIDRDKELTFVVNARHSGGGTVSETHTVTTASESQHSHQPPVVTEQYVVFLADKDLENRTDLYLAMLDGSAVYRLNGPLVPGGNVYGFKISLDRRYVAYRADQDTRYVYELYVAQADGSGAKKVSGTLASGGVGDYGWAPDSSRIAYTAIQNANTGSELFTSRPDGTNNVRVSGPLVSGGNVYAFRWAPDSSRLAYTADQNTDGVVELFSSRPDGTNNARVSGPLMAGGQVFYNAVTWAPDSSRIAYKASQLTTMTPEMFTSRPDGSGNVRVSHPLTDNDFIYSDAPLWAPDSSRLAYISRTTRSDNSNYYYAENLYTTRPDGTGATQVSAVPMPYGQYRNIGQVSWAPNGTRIAYTAQQNTDNVFELFSSGPDCAGNVQVSGSLVAGGTLGWYGDVFSWAPDSSRIAYRANQRSSDIYELFTSDPVGNNNVRASGSLVTGGNVGSFSWAPDSRYLAYTADQLVKGRLELYTATPDGSLNPRVSGQMAQNGNVQGFAWSADGSRLVYRADQLVDEQYELFVAAPDGNAVNTNISGTLTANGDVFGFATQ